MVPSGGARLALCGCLTATAIAPLRSDEPVRKSSAIGAAGPVANAPPQASSPSKNLSSALSFLAEAAVKDGETAGISFTVRKGRTVLAEGAFGFADLENRVPAGVETVYAIGSLTKPFTAAAVLLLADEGKLSLDDPLGKFVPAFPEPGRSATVRMLLNHTSGIRSMTSLGPRYWAQAGRELEPSELVALFANEPADFPAGTDYRYSNSGYVLLGLVVEKASGKPWGAFLKERFFGPLGLTRTRDGESAELVLGRARGYSRRKAGGFENAWGVNLTQGYAAGALLSTVGDLAAWTRRLHTAPPVSPSAYRSMTSPSTLPNGKALSYGYGLGVDSFGGHRRFFHGGGLPGFDGWVAFFPGDDLTVVALCNTDGDVGMKVADAMASLALGVPGTKTRVSGR
ncbi:MAG TPA: serine hydrolase domain-containing protein [Thermoanaerobaculia bacterium]|nr:serine hydrolase domain-containing protein [Thermoanaerobaculia bacterium]